MSYLGSKDFLIEVQKGLVAKHTLIHKFGRNAAVPNASWAFINTLGFTAWPLSAATTVRVKAGGNSADDTAGNGAREITIQGIDDSFNEVEEAVATAGASASAATSASFWRVHRAWVSSAGTYGAANTATVVVENSAGGTDLIQILVEEGQSQFGGWSVPTGFTAYLLSALVTTDSVKPSDIRFFTRANFDDASAPVNSKRLKLYWDGLTGVFLWKPRSPLSAIAAKSDMWFEAQGSGAITEVSVDFEILLVAD